MRALIVFVAVLVSGFSYVCSAQSLDDFLGTSQAHQQKEIKPPSKQYFLSPHDEKEKALSQEQDGKSMDSRPPAHTQNAPQRSVGDMSKGATYHAGIVAKTCPGNWEARACLNAMSETYLTASALYAEKLQNSGHKDETENVKEHCAASTAAPHVKDVPAYAMRSAFAECANEFSDIYDRTQVMPDQELLQLMAMAVMCMDKDARCAVMETGLKSAMGQ